MPRFANLKIRTKVLVLLALLALVSLAASVFATGRMRYIDDTYGDIIDGPTAANLAIARANRDMVFIDRSIYRLLAEPTEAGIAAARKEISDTEGYFRKQIERAVRGMPSRTAEIRAVADRYAAAMSGGCREVIRMASSAADADKKLAAARMHETCDPALNALMLDISALTNKIVAISDKASDDASTVTSTTIRFTYVMILGGLSVVTLFALYLTRIGIAAPIRSIAVALQELADGNFDVEIRGFERKDELGGFARAALVFRDRGREAERLRAERAAAQERAVMEKLAALGAMAEKIETEANAAVQQVTERVGAMNAIAGRMRALAGHTGTAAQDAANQAQVALANVQTVASAAEQLAASIGEIGNQVSQSTGVVAEAVAASNTARSEIQVLDEQIGRISVVADLISDIAAKTNLLALNATIEAARAGDAGKGFAVVASEVKNLANRTAGSTQEISRRISEVASATAAVVSAVARIEATVNGVNDIAQSIATAVHQQGAATGEIARNATATASAVNDMTTRTNQVSQDAAQVGQYTEEALAHTTRLETAVDELRHTMIRIVRTSTDDVDRRKFKRFGIDAACRVEVPGRNAVAARIADISEGGAHLAEPHGMAASMRGLLHVAGLAVPLPFRVAAVEDGGGSLDI